MAVETRNVLHEIILWTAIYVKLSRCTQNVFRGSFWYVGENSFIKKAAHHKSFDKIYFEKNYFNEAWQNISATHDVVHLLLNSYLLSYYVLSITFNTFCWIVIIWAIMHQVYFFPYQQFITYLLVFHIWKTILET